MNSRLSARGAVHLAVTEGKDVASIVSLDSDFDQRPALKRIH